MFGTSKSDSYASKPFEVQSSQKSNLMAPESIIPSASSAFTVNNQKDVKFRQFSVINWFGNQIGGWK